MIDQKSHDRDCATHDSSWKQPVREAGFFRGFSFFIAKLGLPSPLNKDLKQKRLVVPPTKIDEICCWIQGAPASRRSRDLENHPSTGGTATLLDFTSDEAHQDQSHVWIPKVP
jgi:hypothetical protein